MKSLKILQLDLNERLSPPEARVANSLCRQAWRANRYVRNEECELVKKLIARAHKINPTEIVLFNGSWNALLTIFSFLFHERDEVIVPVPTFPFYPEFELHRQFKIKKVSGLSVNLTAEKIGRSLSPKTKGLYLVNPTNPLGELINPQEIIKILDLTVKKKILVVLDEAYGELAGIDSAHLIKKYSNLIITKSGSKAYGLGGARVGYIMTNKKLATILGSVRGPSYTLSAPAIAALTAFYLEVKPFLHYVEEIREVREELKKLLSEKNIKYFDSQANFVTFAVKSPKNFVANLLKKGILIKNLSDYPDGGELTKNLVRVTVPPKKDWARLKKALTEVFSLS